jgi:ribonuclease HII
MKAYYYKDEIEAGVDEVARGCLAGPVFTSAVVWPKEIDPSDTNIIVNDSKKLSRRKRLMLKDYIEEYALDFSVSQVDNKTIDKINILNATYKCMHKSLNTLNIKLDHIIVDGDKFLPYKDKSNSIIPYTCIVKGDSKYVPIASASILAKVYHDLYIEKLCDENGELEVYDWRNNMCYGTKKHIDSIKQNGITKYHRKTFGICNIYGT